MRCLGGITSTQQPGRHAVTMIRRTLGQDGPEIAAIGYGSMSFGAAYGPTTRDQSVAILDAMREEGLDHFDTAFLYAGGQAETIFGEYCAASASARSFFTVATKGGIYRGDPAGNDGFPNNNSPAFLTEQLEASLRRLQTECVDLYYLHRWDPRLPIEAVMETLVGFKQAGKIRAIGLSEVAPSTLRRAASVHPIAAVQSEYSLWTRQPELGMLQTCAELGTAFVAFSPVGRGILTDRPVAVGDDLSGWFIDGNPRFTEPNLSANLAWTDRFRALAGDKGVPAATLALAWVLAKGEHTIAIPGTRSVTHLREAAQAAALRLTAEEVAEIEAVLPIGFAHGDRYSDQQWRGQERYC
jgi:aryl-alcohol dehydrogenase-like predicted oxidoreductase